ncbi:MAG: hypothetical protein ABFD97_03670 [Syntrophobacter sp.]
MDSLAALEGFINRHDISMQVSRMNDPDPVAEQEGVERYKCHIRRPGKEVNVYVAVPTEEERLTPPDVLFMLILDASGCEMLKDYYGRHEQMPSGGNDGNFAEFEEFWDEYRSRCRQTRKFKAFLGKNLYGELIVQFGFKD